jgi:hypothetical protein
MLHLTFLFMSPVTEKHEGDGVASKAPDKRDAGLLETL